MLSFEQIEAVEAFDASDARVLSAYLRLDPGRQSFGVVFENLVKAAHDTLDVRARRDLLKEAADVERWLSDQKPRGTALAVFSCTPRGLWQHHWLAVPVDNHLAFEPKPDIAPLLAIVDDYERYVVALVDKRHARLLSVFAGEIEESDSFDDPVPGKHDQGALAQSRFQRHHESHVHWHLKRVVEHVSAMLRRRRFDRLIIAGPREATSELQRLLPRALAHRLVAVIPGDISASTQEILQKTLEIERRAEQELEQRLLEELLETARAGGRATSGLTPTLDALWLGDVRTLVVAERADVEGSECPNCGRLEADVLDRCRACGADMKPVHDLFHRAMGRTLEQAGSVEVLHSDAARRLQETAGGLGALLRFPAPMTDLDAARE